MVIWSWRGGEQFANNLMIIVSLSQVCLKFVVRWENRAYVSRKTNLLNYCHYLFIYLFSKEIHTVNTVSHVGQYLLVAGCRNRLLPTSAGRLINCINIDDNNDRRYNR